MCSGLKLFWGAQMEAVIKKEAGGIFGRPFFSTRLIRHTFLGAIGLNYGTVSTIAEWVAVAWRWG